MTSGRIATGAVVLAAALVAGASVRAAPPSSPPAPVAPPEAAQDAPPPPVADEPPVARPGGALAVDAVLPCGVRVLAARDVTLPVTAVVLAVETGTEDDPSDSPGLVHALAYHLLQGNRDYAPGDIARAVHGAGGVTMLAIGPAQVRYESLVPASMLGEMIAAEAARLRAPTVSETLWKDTLRWARRDRQRAWSVPPAVRAAAHQAEGLAHDGHAVPEALAAMSERAVSSQLAERFTYDRATLIIVSPEAPEFVLNAVMTAFADLPPTPRRARDRTAVVHHGSAARQVVAKSGGGAFVWPIAADPRMQAWAEVTCGALNRLRRASHESTRARLRCAIDDDPRRGLMILRPSGVDDPQALVRDRLQRVAADEGGHLGKERTAAIARGRYGLRTPLMLARHLARAAAPGPAAGAKPMRPLAELLGPDALEHAEVPNLVELFDLGAAIHAVDAVKPTPAGAP